MKQARIAVGAVVLVVAVVMTVIALVNRDDWGNAPVVALLLLGAVGAALASTASVPAGEDGTGRAVAGGLAGAGGVLVGAFVLIGLVLAIIFLFQTMLSGMAHAIGDAIHGRS